MTSLVSVSKLSRFYGDHCAVNDISFKLEKGDILGFLGPNGAGKSTTMQMITGNLAPHHGSISINAYDLVDEPVAARKQLGYLPETPPLYRELTVAEYLEYCARLHLLPPAEIGQAVNHAIKRCDLASVRKRLIRNLSKGFQQRVGIAQAILHQPPVIILDEPTVGLDPIQIIDIRALISELGTEHGIILCTHILPEVQAVCNRVQIINQGMLVYSNDLNDNDDSVRQYEIELGPGVELASLVAADCIKEARPLGNNRFVVDSDRDAGDISQSLCRQGFGLRYFSPYQDSLENTFVTIISQDSTATAHEAPATEVPGQ